MTTTEITPEAELAGVEAALRTHRARRDRISADLANVTAGSKNFAQAAGWREELKALDLAIAEGEERAHGLRPIVRERQSAAAQRQYRIDEARAILDGVRAAPDDPRATRQFSGYDLPALWGELTGEWALAQALICNRLRSAAALLRAEGVEVPDEITLTIRLK